MILAHVSYVWELLLGDIPFEARAKFGLPIGTIGSFGLVLYAFEFDLPLTPFWAIFQLVFGIDFFVDLWVAVKEYAPLRFATVGFAVVVVMGTFTWLALYRLGGSPFGAIPIF